MSLRNTIVNIESCLSDILSRLIRGAAFAPTSPNEAPIFIIGSGRSGNTLLRSMLIAGGGISIPPESYVLPTIIRRYSYWRFLSWQQICERVICTFENHPEFIHWRLDLDTIMRDALELPQAERNLYGLISCIYKSYGLAHTDIKSFRWGDKTPLNAFSLSLIKRAFPDAIYIHLIRDPRAVVASYIKAAENGALVKENTIAKAADRWLSAQRSIASFKSDNLIAVKYEDLVLNPDLTVRKVCKFVDLPYDENMINHHRADNRLGDVDAYKHHENATKPMDTSRIDGWKTSLSTAEENKIKNKTKNIASKYKYFQDE